MWKLSVVSALITFFCASSTAQNRSFGDWIVVDADDGSGDVIAATTAEGSDTEYLAMRCFIKQGACVHAVRLRSDCELDSSYPVLMNSDAGAASIKATCVANGKTKELGLAPFDDVRSAIDTGRGQLGLAIPLQSGAFRAIRFSLRGSKQAVEAAERRAEQRKSTPSATRRGTF